MPDAMRMLEQSPLPSLIEGLGVAIADAQFALDRSAIAIARMLADPENAVAIGNAPPRTLLELGFAPTFYHLTEANVEARVAFTTTQSQEFAVGASVGVNIGFFAASVDASYSSKYSFKAEGSSSISARFVSVPAPTVFHDLLRSSVTDTEEP